MLREGSIRPPKSLWSFPVVLIWKWNWSLRFLVDYYKLNKCTVKDSITSEDWWGIGCIGEQKHFLLRFEKLILASGDGRRQWRKNITINIFTISPLEFYLFNSMPFWLSNSPATFQRLMQTCISDLHLAICLLFLDNIFVYSSTWKEHLRRLEAVFQCLEEFGQTKRFKNRNQKFGVHCFGRGH